MNRKQRRAAGTPRPAPGSAECCPKCKSTATKMLMQPFSDFYAKQLATCNNCGAAWEPVDGKLLLDPDDPVSCFTDPCDNCAFRPGAPEQKKQLAWRELIAALKAGSPFFCHKGVAISPGSEHGFDYPFKDGKADKSKLRYCRGYLNALGAWMDKEKPPAELQTPSPETVEA